MGWGRVARSAAAVVTVATVAVLLVSGRPPSPWSGWLSAALAVAAAGCCLARGRRHPPGRSAWQLFAAAVAVEGLSRLPMGGPGALAPYGDVLGPVALALLAAGLVALPGDAADGWRLVIDAAAVAAATVVVGLHVLSAPDVAGHGGAAVVRAHIGAAAAVGVALLVAVTRARGTAASGALRLGLLALAAVSAVAADLHATVVHGAAAPAGTGVGWVVAFGAVILATLVDRLGERDATVREYVAVLAPMVPAVLGAGLAVHWAGEPQGLGAVSAAFAVFLIAALILRLGVARVDQLVVAHSLEAKVAERTMGLVTREQWFRSLVQNSSDVLTVINAGGVIRYQSPAVTRVFGHDPNVLVGTPVAYLMRETDVSRLQQLISEAVLHPRATYVIEFAVWHTDGRWCETETAVTSLLDDQDVRGLVLNTRDISERKRLEDALTHQAFHDNLTGLANRVLFQDRVAQALAQNRRRDRVGVLFLDLDGFKGVNDTQGHAMGDRLLGLVAERLRNCVRPGDMVARLGGDEFAVLVADADCPAAAVAVAERMLAAIAQPFLLDGRENFIGVSIGIALNMSADETADVLLRNADVAMYKAKARRKGGWVRFEPGMRDALVDQMEMEHDLKQALLRGQLDLYYQPTVELDSGLAVGAEALLRWYHPRRGLVGPDQFIRYAEDTGLIVEIGEWVLRETCRQGARWQAWANPGQHFHVAVNISARQVVPALVDTVRQALHESGLPPAALVLEVTESVLVERTDEVLGLLQQLKALGVRLAIDDFGTGYSSLSYLSRFPVDVLKIDKSFVEHVAEPGEQSELSRTIVHLGRNLRLSTVAEGIETRAQYHALRQIGCDLGQGYLFARAMPAAGLDELLGCRMTPAAGADATPAQLPVLPVADALVVP